MVDAAISESMFNMLEGCVPELAAHGATRPPSGSTLTGVVPSGTWRAADGVYVIIGGNGNSGGWAGGGRVGAEWSWLGTSYAERAAPISPAYTLRLLVMCRLLR